MTLGILAGAGVALGAAQGAVYLLTEFGVLSAGMEARAVLAVLVFGCAVNYGLLPAARFREELPRQESASGALRAARGWAWEPIVASAGTIALGMLCLLVSGVAAVRPLGPLVVIGVVCAMLAALTVVPAVLGRAAVQPVPQHDARPAGIWERVAGLVERRARVLWRGIAAVLGVLALGVLRLDSPVDGPAVLLVLAVVFVLLAWLLRSLVAPLLLLGTVVLSVLAAIGVSAVVLPDGLDVAAQLYAFVLLTAFALDHTMFLVTRTHDECKLIGTRRGALVGIVPIGGVITSAGLVLAVASGLGLALVPLTALAFTVAFGVLLDSFVVRPLLVPALTADTGRWMWWPRRLPADGPAGVRDVAPQRPFTP